MMMTDKGRVNMKTHEELIRILRNCYESGQFETIYPYLAEDVKRVSQWALEDISGKENVIAYFKEKEELFKQNKHYFAELAVLKYIDGQPAGFSRRNVVSAKGSMAGENEIPQGTQIVQWYAEGQMIIHLASSPFDPTVVLVLIDFNQENLIKQISLCGEELYHYEIVKDSNLLSHAELHKKVCKELFFDYFYQGYEVHMENKGYANFPSFMVKKNGVFENYYVIVDHYPFYGKTNPGLDSFLENLASKFDGKQTVLLIQAQAKTVPYHLITNDEEFNINIIKSYELNNGETKHENN